LVLLTFRITAQIGFVSACRHDSARRVTARLGDAPTGAAGAPRGAAPLGSPLTISVDDERHAISREVTSLIGVA
jgi:hypothetical protein